MTEQEAKAKWCPFARVDSTGSNRPNPGPNADTQAGWPPCIGSACMAWRWDPNQAVGEYNSQYDRIKKPHMRRGSCGLAGKL